MNLVIDNVAKSRVRHEGHTKENMIFDGTRDLENLYVIYDINIYL